MFTEFIAEIDASARAHGRAPLPRQVVEPGHVLFSEGAPAGSAFVVESGALIAEAVTTEGVVVAFGLIEAGEMVGHLGLIADEPRSATVRALTRSQLAEFDPHTFDRLRDEERRFERLLITMLDHRVRTSTRFLFEMRGADARERIRLVLDRLEATFGAEVPLSQQVIAALAGTTRQTANEELRDLEAIGTLRLGRGRVTFTQR